jgi:hypothetical protein
VPESCPAITTCPQICVTNTTVNTTDCPTTCDDGQNLCNDGSCSEEECDEELESPCWCAPLFTACPRTIDFYDSCLEDYGNYYTEYDTCLAEYYENLPKVSFFGPWFLFCYIWIVSVTILVFGWCFYNQKLCPVEGSTLILTPISSGGPEERVHEWTQTGYKNHWWGLMLNFLVWITLFGIQFLLFVLTIFYYIQQESITRWPVVFEDDIQCLFTFQ